MASISACDIGLPILVDVGYVIVATAAVAKAGKRNGLVELSMVVANQWSEYKVSAYRLSRTDCQAFALR